MVERDGTVGVYGDGLVEAVESTAWSVVETADTRPGGAQMGEEEAGVGEQGESAYEVGVSEAKVLLFEVDVGEAKTGAVVALVKT